MPPLAAHSDSRWLDAPDPKKLLKIAEVSELVGLSRSMIYKCIKDPKIMFPSPLKIGVLSRWDRDAVFEWVESIRS